MSASADWLRPDWHAPSVGALMTTRAGGCSAAPFDSMNLHAGGADSPEAVARNRAVLAEAIGAMPVFLKQVHATAVVRLHAADGAAGAAVHTADASVTTERGIACAIQIADCLPVLFAAPAGRAVGAAHAGWRGLAGGVLEATVAAVCEAAPCDPADLQAWIGAGIGPTRFQVGADVVEAFGGATVGGHPSVSEAGAWASRPSAACFVPEQPGKWLANLPLLARERLHAAGVADVGGGTWCTVSDASRFFSFRRDGVTGRMAAVVWIERGG